MKRALLVSIFGLSLSVGGSLTFGASTRAAADGVAKVARTNRLADPRPFTLVDDAYPEGPGVFEIENGFSYGHRTQNDHGFNGVDVEHEFEFGLAENIDLKIPVEYHYENSDEASGFHFDAVGVQLTAFLTNPFYDPIGVALIGEVAIGEDSLTFEQFVVLQKDFGPWIVAYNIGAETEIEGVFDNNTDREVTGVLINALGVAYQATPTLRVGVQGVAESEYADWNHYEGTVVYAGPVLNYYGGGSNWWITVSPNFLLTNQDEEAQFRLDFIFALSF